MAEHEEECSENPENQDECEYCGGKNGEHEDIATMESVYPGEAHTAPVGLQRCPNSLIDDEEEYDDQE